MDSDQLFAGKARLRVCGLLEENGSLLLLKHDGLGDAGHIWSPPGGGLEHGESVTEALCREFREEVNLEIEAVKMLFVNEYTDLRFHAVELFFEVKKLSGTVQLGKDPEMGGNDLLSEVRLLTWDEIDRLPPANKHNAFRFCSKASEIFDLNGFFNFRNIG